MPEPQQPQACRIPVPCDPKELGPLITHLEQGTRVSSPVRFPRGTLTPDGRLDLCKQDVGPENLARIVTALSASKVVTSLLLGADFIGDQGAAHLAKLLERNESLETLFLGCNGIGAAGADALCGAAEDHRGLRGLWLKRNRLGERGAESVARLVTRSRTLRTLDLADTAIGRTGLNLVLRALIEHNRTLERVYLCANGFDADDCLLIAELLRSACPLRELYLSTNNLGDTGCRILAEAIPSSAHITVLGLASTGMTQKGAASLARVLRSGKIRGLELGQAPSMGLHAARRNEIGDEGAAHLARALQFGVSLGRLLLGGNGIGAQGGSALMHGLETNFTLTQLEVGRLVPKYVKARIAELLQRNRQQAESQLVPRDIAAIESVYRTVRSHRRDAVDSINTKPSRSPANSTIPAAGLAPERLRDAVEVLEELRGNAAVFFSEERGRYAVLRAAANRLIHAIVNEATVRCGRHRPERGRGEKLKQPPHAPDEPRAAVTDLERGHVCASRGDLSLRAIENRSSNERSQLRGAPCSEGSSHQRTRVCYICKGEFREAHTFYEALCGDCGTLNHLRREQSADLSGQTALVTGGRIKVGHHVALKLLRAGCRVLVTTRFPSDAVDRFSSQADFESWQGHLTIIPIDLRDLHSVHVLTQRLVRELESLDILVNNAAMTIFRPPSYYDALVEREVRGVQGGLEKLLLLPSSTAPHQQQPSSEAAIRVHGGPHPVELSSSLLSQITLVSAHPTSWSKFNFPPGESDREGLQLDLRSANSWSARFEEITTGELLEVHLVSQFAPFVLSRNLLPLLRRSKARTRHIVNVSAMEGSFSRSNKTSTHVHTNMAKSALNMMTRTLGEELARERIFMNSVDTGWITDERPHGSRKQAALDVDFVPPLDAIDGAARVCDPVFRATLGEFVGFGQFFKDYRPVSW